VKPRIVLLRGHAVNPWELGPWERLTSDYEIAVVVTDRNLYDASSLALQQVPARTISSLLPAGRAGELLTRLPGDRYLQLEPHLRGAAIVHAAELGYWFTWQAAQLKRSLPFRLAATVWETLPFLGAYRNVRTRRYVRDVLAAVDVFLPTTQRARLSLELEGAEAGRIVVCPPGIRVEDFARGRVPDPPNDGNHVVLSVGRLVWEKGHQDVIRALALLRRRGRADVRLVIAGVGPERRRLAAHAHELGVGTVVEFVGSVPYARLPELYARASCLVLASLPTEYWEEQFGMVLAEGLAAHLPIVAAASGAIPEVLDGNGELFDPGDWAGLADRLAAGPLADGPGTRRAPDPALVGRYGIEAATERLRSVYERLVRR
jgi:glycosyltransferase involved in cell wall biosynthesis